MYTYLSHAVQCVTLQHYKEYTLNACDMYFVYACVLGVQWKLSYTDPMEPALVHIRK